MQQATYITVSGNIEIYTVPRSHHNEKRYYKTPIEREGGMAFK